MSVSEPAVPRQKISREGVVLIKSFEGFRPRAEQRDDGVWVIGYGHTASARTGVSIGEADAELLLQYDLIPVAKALNDTLATSVNPHQFDALASFAFSVGVSRFMASDVLEHLKVGEDQAAADALLRWPEQPRPDAAVSRRAAERALFLTDPDAPVTLANLVHAPVFAPAAFAPAAFAPAAFAPAAAQSVKPEKNPRPAPHTDPRAEARNLAVSTLLGEGSDEETGAASVADPHAPTAPSAARYSAYVPETVGPLHGPDIATDALISPVAAGDLVLTGSDTQTVSTPRLDWPGQASATDAQPPLFDATSSLEDRHNAILRHEPFDPRRPSELNWTDTGAFVLMGGLGLVSCAMAAVAFRRAAGSGAEINDSALIGWGLAVIGIVCVGVAAYNLYRRWGHARA